MIELGEATQSLTRPQVCSCDDADVGLQFKWRLPFDISTHGAIRQSALHTHCQSCRTPPFACKPDGQSTSTLYHTSLMSEWVKSHGHSTLTFSHGNPGAQEQGVRRTPGRERE